MTTTERLSVSGAEPSPVQPPVVVRLAEHVGDLRYDDLPPDVVDKAKDLLVHHLGLALGSHDTDGARQVTTLVEHLDGAAGDTTIIGEARKANLLEAVMANSFLMSHQAMDDFALPNGLHTGTVTLPAALAAAERAGASGRELVTAIVAGYDVPGKLANLVWGWAEERPRRPNAVFGPLGAAAATARLLGLTPEQIADALGLAADAGMCLIENSAFMWPMHALMTRNGVLAAVMASSGFGAARTMIEGEHGLFRSFFGRIPDGLDASLDTLGHSYEILGAITKRYAVSGLNIVPVQLTLELVKAYSLGPDDVAAVTVVLPTGREDREPVWERAVVESPSPMTRKGSLRHLVASVVADGAIDPDRAGRPPGSTIETLLGRIQLRFEPGHTIRYARIEFTTTSGARHTAEGDDYVLPSADRGAWLRAGGEGVVTDKQLATLEDLIAHLEDVDDVSELTACLAPR